MARGRPRLAVLGGTFDHFHLGHQALLLAGLRAGDQLGVGVTTARFLDAHPKPFEQRIQPYAVRRRAVERFLKEHAARGRFFTTGLNDVWGRSVEPGVGVLVVSPDTVDGAQSVNAERERRGLERIPVRVVPLVLGDDLLPVSGRRVRSGVITPDGRRRTPLAVRVMSEDPSDRSRVARALRRWAPDARVNIAFARSSAPVSGRASPRGLPRLADRRARSALESYELGIGIARDMRTRPGGAVAVRDASGPWRGPPPSPSPEKSVERALHQLFEKRARRRGRLRPEGVYTHRAS